MVVSVASVFLALVLGCVTVYQAIHKPPEAQALRDLLSQEEQETRAKLVLKVLEAPQDAKQPLLAFLTNAKLLKLEPAQQKELKELLQKAQQSAH